MCPRQKWLERWSMQPRGNQNCLGSTKCSCRVNLPFRAQHDNFLASYSPPVVPSIFAVMYFRNYSTVATDHKKIYQ